MKKHLLTLALCCVASLSFANSEAKLEKIQVDPSVPAVKRGVEAFMDSCHSCHSLKYIKYQDLVGLGFDKAKVKEWQGDWTIDAPVMGMMPDDGAMAAFGTLPPELSLMARARDGGNNYLYSYLMAYYTGADGVTGNHVFPASKMPDPLGISSATEPAQRAEIAAKAKDIVSFLNWAADPHEQERYKLGTYILGYLFVLTSLLFLMKKRIWARLD
jgi:cytochrome c1